MSTKPYPWDLNDSKKELVFKHFIIFLKPDAQNLVYRLTDFLSEREVGLVTRISQNKANEDVMRELLDYLMKRPYWWEKLTAALEQTGYTEQAAILKDGEMSDSQQQPSRPPPNQHVPPRSVETPHHPVQTLPDHYYNHNTQYSDTQPPPGQQLAPSDIQDDQPPPYQQVAALPVQRGYQQYTRPPGYQQYTRLPGYQQYTQPPGYQQNTQPPGYNHPAVTQEQQLAPYGYQNVPPPPVAQEQRHLCNSRRDNFPIIVEEPLPQYQQQQYHQLSWNTPQKIQERSQNVSMSQECFSGAPSLIMDDQDKALKKAKSHKVDVSKLDLCQQVLCKEKENATDRLAKNMQQHLASESLPAPVSFSLKNVSEKDSPSVDSKLPCNPEERAKLKNVSEEDSPADSKHSSNSEERSNQKNVSQKDGPSVDDKLSCKPEERPNADIVRSSANEASTCRSHSPRHDVNMHITSTQLSGATMDEKTLQRTLQNSIHTEASNRKCSAGAVVNGESDARNTFSKRDVSYPPSLPKTSERRRIGTDEDKQFDKLILAVSLERPLNNHGNKDNGVIAEGDNAGLPEKFSSERGIHISQSVCYPPSVPSSNYHNVNKKYGTAASSVCYPPSISSGNGFERDSTIKDGTISATKDRQALPKHKESVESMEIPSNDVTVESNENNLSVPMYSEVQPMSGLEKKQINVSGSIRDVCTNDTGNRPNLSLLVSCMTEKLTLTKHDAAESTNQEDQIDKYLYLENSSESVELKDISTINTYLEEPEDEKNREDIQSLLHSGEHIISDAQSYRLTTMEFEQWPMGRNMTGTLDRQDMEEHQNGEHDVLSASRKPQDRVPSEISLCEDKPLYAQMEETVNQSVHERNHGDVGGTNEPAQTEELVSHQIDEDGGPSGMSGYDEKSLPSDKLHPSEMHEKSETSWMHEMVGHPVHDESHKDNSSAESSAYGEESRHTNSGEVANGHQERSLMDTSSAGPVYGHELKQARMAEVAQQPALGGRQEDDEVCRSSVNKEDQYCAKMDEISNQFVREGTETFGQEGELGSAQINELANQAVGRETHGNINPTVSRQQVPSVFRSFLSNTVTKVVVEELLCSLK